MYHTLLKMPWRIWTIKKLVGLAFWLTRPTMHGKPILEHYSIALEAETGTGKIVTRDVKRAAILVQHFEVLTYRDQQTAADDELLNDAAAIYLGADNQGEFK